MTGMFVIVYFLFSYCVRDDRYVCYCLLLFCWLIVLDTTGMLLLFIIVLLLLFIVIVNNNNSKIIHY